MISSLMQQDELATISKINRYKKSVTQHVQFNNGQIIQDLGDGHFLLFSSGDQAIRAAIGIQKDVSGFIPLRIGMHSGKIQESGGNYYGDTINIASRIETFAVPGSILTSASTLSSSHASGITRAGSFKANRLMGW